ncbi:MAG: hypothetical protein A2033_15450 [Bacteroidetes bacterium GWA2_31_9]|nr:MAG: hypothetical protein A2033_15450 [Bacteroidetes bacterium GWA2_31_9]
MIIDLIENKEKYYPIHIGIMNALKNLENILKQDLTPKQRIDLDNDVYYLYNETITKNKDEMKWEVHHKYVDIHYLIEGVETIGYANNFNNVNIIGTYDENSDYALFEGNGEYITLKPSMFAIFFPHEIHKPIIALNNPEKIKKIVCKVKF